MFQLERGYNKEGQEFSVYEIDGGSISKTDVTSSVTKKVTSLSISPDGARAAVVDDKVINIFEFADGFEVQHFHKHSCSLCNGVKHQRLLQKMHCLRIFPLTSSLIYFLCGLAFDCFNGQFDLSRTAAGLQPSYINLVQ